jgi:hypothetical protein
MKSLKAYGGLLGLEWGPQGLDVALKNSDWALKALKSRRGPYEALRDSRILSQEPHYALKLKACQVHLMPSRFHEACTLRQTEGHAQE